MRRARKSLVIGAILGISAATTAQAEPFKMKLSPLYVLAASPVATGEVRNAQPGEEIIRANLGFGRTASLRNDASLTLLDLPLEIPAAYMLRAATPEQDDPRLAPHSEIFCSKMPNPPRKLRKSSDGRGARLSWDISLCLVDADVDGRFESAFIIGAKWGEDQRLISISPLDYQVDGEFRILGQLKLTYERGAALQGPILSMESDLVDGKFAYAEARIGPDPRKAPRLYGERGVGRPHPKPLTYGDAQITILGLDSATRVLTYRIDHGFENRPAVVTVGFHGMYGSTEYVFE